MTPEKGKRNQATPTSLPVAVSALSSWQKKTKKTIL